MEAGTPSTGTGQLRDGESHARKVGPGPVAHGTRRDASWTSDDRINGRPGGGGRRRAGMGVVSAKSVRKGISSVVARHVRICCIGRPDVAMTSSEARGLCKEGSRTSRAGRGPIAGADWQEAARPVDFRVRAWRCACRVLEAPGGGVWDWPAAACDKKAPRLPRPRFQQGAAARDVTGVHTQADAASHQHRHCIVTVQRPQSMPRLRRAQSRQTTCTLFASRPSHARPGAIGSALFLRLSSLHALDASTLLIRCNARRTGSMISLIGRLLRAAPGPLSLFFVSFYPSVPSKSARLWRGKTGVVWARLKDFHVIKATHSVTSCIIFHFFTSTSNTRFALLFLSSVMMHDIHSS